MCDARRFERDRPRSMRMLCTCTRLVELIGSEQGWQCQQIRMSLYRLVRERSDYVDVDACAEVVLHTATGAHAMKVAISARDICNDCGTCTKGPNMLRCSGCKMVWYCNAVCQRRSWKAHKRLGVTPAKAQGSEYLSTLLPYKWPWLHCGLHTFWCVLALQYSPMIGYNDSAPSWVIHPRPYAEPHERSSSIQTQHFDLKVVVNPRLSKCCTAYWPQL